MADHLRLTEARQADAALAFQAAEAILHFRRIRQVDAGAAGLALFEDQRFFHQQAAVAGDGAGGVAFGLLVRRGRASLAVQHHSTSLSAATSAVMSSSELASVTESTSGRASCRERVCEYV